MAQGWKNRRLKAIEMRSAKEKPGSFQARPIGGVDNVKQFCNNKSKNLVNGRLRVATFCLGGFNFELAPHQAQYVWLNPR